MAPKTQLHHRHGRTEVPILKGMLSSLPDEKRSSAEENFDKQVAVVEGLLPVAVPRFQAVQ